MAENFTQLPLGACILKFKGANLGETSENCVFRYSEDDAPINVAQQGTTPVDEIVVGHTVEFEVELTRTQIVTISSLLAGADNSGSSGDEIEVQNRIGISRYEGAGLLEIIPIIGANTPTTNESAPIYIYKAAPKADMEVNYNNSDQRVFRYVFVGYPDQTEGKSYRIWGNQSEMISPYTPPTASPF